MKTALLLIPSTDNAVARRRYLRMCIEKVYNENYIPFTPVLYESTAVNQTEFIASSLDKVDAIFLFINYGIDKPMLDVVDVINGKKEIMYRRINDCEMQEGAPHPYTVLMDVCRRTGITPEQVMSKTRKREIVDARQIYFRRCRELTKASLSEIGSVVYRDHATVLHGEKEAKNTNALVKLYDKCYGSEAIEGFVGKENEASEFVDRPVLPYNSNDPREQIIPSSKYFQEALNGRLLKHK